MATQTATTRMLAQLGRGDGHALEALVPQVYDELHDLAGRLMRSENSGHTLQATSLVNEAFVRLAAGTPVDWQGRTHLLAIAATTMRRILLDAARARRSLKRGGPARARVSLESAEEVASADPDDLVGFDELLSGLAELSPRQSRVVELRVFGDMTVPQVAGALSISERTVKEDWRAAVAWLRTRALEGDAREPREA